MENWGCITFLDSVFLSQPEDTSAETFQRNARTIVHEVSHMWFGNLVTMKWWDDIWLNEGFARFAEHHILSQIRPEFLMWEKYNHKVFKVSIEADKMLSKTHPVLFEVLDVDKLQHIFDTISYAKGSIACKMLAEFTGSAFKECLKKYMHTY